MKKLRFLMMFLMLGHISTFAMGNEFEPEIPNAEIISQLVELLPDHFFGLDEERLVKVHFTFNSKGELVVLKIANSNRQIRRYFKKRLNKTILNNPGIQDKVYYLPFRIVETKNYKEDSIE